MSTKNTKVERDTFLYREGDPSDTLYMIKSGRIALVKSNFNLDDGVQIAERVTGEIIGDLSFFDKKPRSTSARALVTSEVVEMPIAGLMNEFNAMPSWAKTLIKTANTQIRDANTRIKNLEGIAYDSKDKILPHTLLRICALLDLLGSKGDETEDGMHYFPYKELFFYCSKVFHIQAEKLKKGIKALQSLHMLDVQETDVGQMVVLQSLETIHDFTMWFNEMLGKDNDEKVIIEEKDLPPLYALAYYGQEKTPDTKGQIKIDLNHIQTHSAKDIEKPFKTDDVDGLIKKKVIQEKLADSDGLCVKFNYQDICRLFNYWTMVHVFNKEIADTPAPATSSAKEKK